MNAQIKNISNYIRDFTKLQEKNKPYFIGIILLGLQNKKFINSIKEYNEEKYVYDLLKEAIQIYNINIEEFGIFRSNNFHMLNIIKLVLEVYEQNPSIDLLNNFYSEFVRYNNRDGSSLGIVLTPPLVFK